MYGTGDRRSNGLHYALAAAPIKNSKTHFWPRPCLLAPVSMRSSTWSSTSMQAPTPKTEEEELEELQGMIGGVPRGMYIKLCEAQRNRDLADEVRRERDEIDALRQRRAEEQKERMDRLREKREQRHEAAKLAHKNKIEEIGRQVREEVRQLEELRNFLRNEHWKEARVRVEHANNLDARLDASEEAQDQQERDDAAEARRKWKEDMAQEKAEQDVRIALTRTRARRCPLLSASCARADSLLALATAQARKHFLNEKVRKGRESRDASMANFAQAKRDGTQDTKNSIKMWEDAHGANRDAYANHVKQMAQKRADERKAAKERNDAKAAARRQSARDEKANDAVASGALAAEVRHNQLMRARSYARRYVPTEEVESMEASDTFRRLYGLTDANGEIKEVKRESRVK